MEEAESLTARGIATPAEVRRSQLPPPLRVDLAPAPAIPVGLPDPSAGSVPLSAPMPEPLAPHLAAPRGGSPRRSGRRRWRCSMCRLAAAPDDPVLLLERAAVLSASGRYAGARRDLERVLLAEPGHVEALITLGVLLSRRGLWIEAVPYIRRAVELRPGFAGGWYQLGESLNHLDHLSDARAAYERAVELEPQHRARCTDWGSSSTA